MAEDTDSASAITYRGPDQRLSDEASFVAYLLQYRNDGEYCDDPVTLGGQLLEDERNGVVLEFLLPSKGNDSERVVQIPLQQLRRAIRCFT
jgi:hypothetical protein